MINLEEFKYLRDHFPYDACASYWNEHVYKRDDFVGYFTLDKIATMTIDEYVVGYGDKTTFCYGLWRGLRQLANISSVFPTAFGVYYSKRLRNYVPDKTRWETPELAFAEMKASILQLLESGEKEDLEALANNPIHSAVKGKILTTYFPNRYLSICAETHVDYYLKAYGLYDNSTKDLNPVFKREILLDIKNNDPIMKDWTLDQFAFFMWGVCPGSPKKNKL